MSIAEFFAKARALAAPAPVTQHDLAIKAMTKVAEGAHRKLNGPRAPKRNLHIGQVSKIGETEHRLLPRKGVRKTVMVPVFYQLMVDGSRYPRRTTAAQHPG